LQVGLGYTLSCQRTCFSSSLSLKEKAGSHYTYQRHLIYTPYQRHLIYTPFRFMRTNADAMRPFFEAVDPATGTGFEEEIGARQEFIENPNVLALFNRLYVNREGKQIKGFFAMAKKGKGTNVKYCKPGSIRRLMAVLNTYDILQCTPEKMMELLPEEFTKWEQEHK